VQSHQHQLLRAFPMAASFCALSNLRPEVSRSLYFIERRCKQSRYTDDSIRVPIKLHSAAVGAFHPQPLFEIHALPVVFIFCVCRFNAPFAAERHGYDPVFQNVHHTCCSSEGKPLAHAHLLRRGVHTLNKDRTLRSMPFSASAARCRT